MSQDLYDHMPKIKEEMKNAIDSKLKLAFKEQEDFEEQEYLDSVNPCLDMVDDIDHGHYTQSESGSEEDLYFEYEQEDISEIPGINWDINVPQDLQDLIQDEFIKYKNSELKDFDSYYKTHVWYQYWPNIKPEEIDPLMAAADYYLLFGIVSNAFVEVEEVKFPEPIAINNAGRKLKRSLKEIEERIAQLKMRQAEHPSSKLYAKKLEAKKIFEVLVNKLDASFREYAHLACGGELRHHEMFGEILTGYRKGAWVHWNLIYQKYGVESIKVMADRFLDFGSSAYGGEPWYNAAKILYERETGALGPDEFTNKQLFVDRVFTLEHNGGCFLDKLNWANHRLDRARDYSLNVHAMTDTILELHADEVTDVEEMIKYASVDVGEFVSNYMDMAVDAGLTINVFWDKKSKAKAQEPVGTKTDPKSMIDWSDLENGKSDIVSKITGPYHIEYAAESLSLPPGLQEKAQIWLETILQDNKHDFKVGDLSC